MIFQILEIYRGFFHEELGHTGVFSYSLHGCCINQVLAVGLHSSSVFMSFLVDHVVEWAHQAVFFNMGQVCCAGSRTYVHEDIYDEFVKRSVARAKGKCIGDPFDNKNEYGPQVGMLFFPGIIAIYFYFCPIIALPKKGTR